MTRAVALLAACALGSAMGYAGYAAAGHEHNYALWNHGQGTGHEATWINPHVHPFLASTDGAARASYVAFAKTSGWHGDEDYDILAHHHLDLTTTLDKCIWQASVRSAQTSLSHHHHGCH